MKEHYNLVKRYAFQDISVQLERFQNFKINVHLDITAKDRT
jgi:hypothetical protein